MTTAPNESPSGFEVARWGSHLCTPKMGGTIRDMTTGHLSITGRHSLYIEYREVWPDQIDDYGNACPACQLEDRTTECNVYVPTRGGPRTLLPACRCCAPRVVLDHPDLDPSRDAIIEYAKED